jgi:hypothetical protein
MAWTTPRTWVTAETVTASILNSHVRDNLDFLYNKDRVRVYRSADKSIADSATEYVNWTDEDYDTNGLHSTVSNNARLTAQVDGMYVVTFNASFDSNSTGRRVISIRKNDSTTDGTGGTRYGSVSSPAVTGLNTYLSLTTHIYLSATDYVVATVYQNSGGALNMNSLNANSSFQMVWVGD